MVIDTDIIVRFLVGDDRGKAERFQQFLNSDQKAVLTDITFAEIFWVLSSFYKFPKEGVLFGLESLIHEKSIFCNRLLLQETIKILRESSLSFIDAYVAAYSLRKSDGRVLSYDKGYDRVLGLRRIEP